MKFMDAGPFQVEIGFCNCPLDWSREMSRRGRSWKVNIFPGDEPATTMQIDAADGGSHIFVTFGRGFRQRTLAERAGLAAHEATHVWQFIALHISEKEAGAEVEAHAIQWITQWLLEQLEAVGWMRR